MPPALNVVARTVHVRQLGISKCYRKPCFLRAWDDGGKFFRNICTSSRENTFTIITNNYDQFTKRKLTL